MLKKIRSYYWKKRDKGKGKQCLFMAFFLCVLFLSLCFLAAKIFMASNKPMPMRVPKNNTNEEKTQETIQEFKEETVEEREEETPDTYPIRDNVDVSGLDSFLAFMKDDVYEKFTNDIVQLCKKENYHSVVKLPFQQIGKTDYDVVSFIKMSDETIYSVVYNLKNNQYTISVSSDTEELLQKEQEKLEKEEQKRLKSEQKKNKDKVQRQKQKVTQKKNAKRKGR